MKNTISKDVLFLLSASLIFLFQSCEKENHCNKAKTDNSLHSSFLVKLDKNGFTKTPVDLTSFTSIGNKDQVVSGNKRGKSDFKANGTLIADGFPTSQFLINFNAVNNESGSKGSIKWTGTLFDSTELKVHYLNIEGNAAVVGGIVNSDNWAFPKGYYICLLIRDNGDGKIGTADQLNHNLFASSTDDGSTLTPSSSFWNTGWYTLNSQVKIK
jgi:hypothetical protein